MHKAKTFPSAPITNAGMAGPSGVENSSPAHITNAGLAGLSGVEGQR